HAVRTGELPSAETDVVHELHARETTRTLAVVGVGVGSRAATGAVHCLVCLTFHLLWLHRHVDAIVDVRSVLPRDSAGFPMGLASRQTVAGVVAAGLRGGLTLPVWTADATLEVIHEADASQALEG